ncbi:MAG TPA: DMT family transporter, partial [Anaerolineae bacterium]|nr:DMT family transporter [Anaerolineae bacterium]
GVVLTFYAAVMGAFLLLFIAWPEGYVAQVEGMSWRGWLAVFYMGIGASGIGYLLYNLSVPRVGPTRTSGVVYSWVPVWTAVLAFLFFGEPITGEMVGSAALVLIGLRLMMMP